MQILSYVAETERHNIRKRQAEGIAAARARGVRLGRPRKTLPADFDETMQLIFDRKLSYREAAAKLYPDMVIESAPLEQIMIHYVAGKRQVLK